MFDVEKDTKKLFEKYSIEEISDFWNNVESEGDIWYYMENFEGNDKITKDKIYLGYKKAPFETGFTFYKDLQSYAENIIWEREQKMLDN